MKFQTDNHFSRKLPAVGWSKHPRGMRKFALKTYQIFALRSGPLGSVKVLCCSGVRSRQAPRLTLKEILANGKLIWPEGAKSGQALHEPGLLREKREISLKFSLNPRLARP